MQRLTDLDKTGDSATWGAVMFGAMENIYAFHLRVLIFIFLLATL